MRVSILKLHNILVASILTDLTDEEVLSFRQDLLQKIRETEPTGVVIDVAALDVIDSYMSRVLSDTARSVELLGLQAVICGMQPSVALTLTEMGRTLPGVGTALNLEHAIELLDYRVKM